MAVWVSPRTLADVVHDINKFSNNVMTRQLMLQVAAEAGTHPATSAAARRVIGDWLDAQGLRFRGLLLDNGSGLSRDSRASAAQLAQLLRHAAAGPLADLVRDSLPVVGVDGTMKARLAGSRSPGARGSRPAASRACDRSRATCRPRRAVAIRCDDRQRPGCAASRALQDEFLRWVYANG